MRAITFSEYGSPEVLKEIEVPKPAPGEGEVLVRIVAAGVNPADWVLRRGDLKRIVRLKFPFTPGMDVAGIVESTGINVTRFKPGDAVYGMRPTRDAGAYAEYVTMRGEDLACIPDALTFTDAAAIPLAALTALQALRKLSQVQAGMRVLVNGASGGVGSFAVQIAKALGAHVTGVASTRNLAFVRDLGADATIDYTAQSPDAWPGTYDVIFDAVGVHPYKALGALLTPRGTMVTINFIYGNPLAAARVRLTGGGKRLKSFLVKPNGSDMEALNIWIEQGKIRPVVGGCYPLAAAAAAQRESETKRVRGKLVLVVDEALAGQTAANGELALIV